MQEKELKANIEKLKRNKFRLEKIIEEVKFPVADELIQVSKFKYYHNFVILF